MSKDISIIGGSAAGFFTSYLLAKKGLNVRLFEERKQICHPSRTLIVTNYMRTLLGSLGQSAIINEINRFELFTDGRAATILLQAPNLIVERSKLNQELTGIAETAGVEVIPGSRFLGLKPNGKRLSFTISRNGGIKEDSAEVIVGADGAFSRVAQNAGWPDPATIPLIQAVVDLPEDQNQDTVRVWFLPEKTPYFFWLIPHSPTQGVLGLIGEDEADTREALEHFMEEKALEPLKLQHAHVPLYKQWRPNFRKIGGGRVYLVGDAAGHVKNSTEGGVVTGFRGAVGVAEAINNGGSSKELRALKRELDSHWLIRKVLNGFTQKDYSDLLDLLIPTTRHSLSYITRDETIKLLRNVILKQPRFLLLGLRSLINQDIFSFKNRV